jgi:hypothetical protein
MFTKKLEDQFSADLLNTVKGILGEAKKCPKDCECEKCEKEDDEEEDDKEEMKEGKRGLWDNIHAKRKRIKAGSGERMRKPGSEGAPTNADFKAASEGVMPTADEPTEANKKTAQKVRDMMAKEKKPVKEEAEQVDEVSKATLGRYINKAKDSIDMASYRQGHKEAHGSSSKPLEKKLTKRHKGISTAVSKLTKEDAEQIDELSTEKLLAYRKKAREADTNKHHVYADEADKKIKKKTGVYNPSLLQRAKAKLRNEDAEQIDELSKGTMGRYINKAATKMGSQGVTAGLKIAADEKSSKNFKDMGKREKGIKLAVSKLTKEEQDFIDSLNVDTLEEANMWHVQLNGKRVSKHFDSEDRAKKFAEYGSDTRKGKWSVHKSMAEEVEIDEGNTSPEIKKAYADLLKTPGGSPERKAAVRHYKSLRQNLAKEEVELEEGRGRPPKEGSAAWHAKQNQASDDMVALGMQLRKAKSMNKKVRFMDNKEHEISANHADRFEDHMAARRTTQEKAAFQKQAHKSHAEFVKAVSAPVPKASKDTGEIVRYRH